MACSSTDFKINLGEYAITVLGRVQTLLIQQVQNVVLEVLEELKKECPPPQRLQQLSIKVNNTRAVLNGAQRQISNVNNIASFLDPVILGAKLYVDIQCKRIDFLSTPIEGPTGTLTFAKTAGEINRMTTRLDRFRKLIETAEDTQTGIRVAASATNAIFLPVLTTLNLIQSLLDQCSTRQDLSDEERREILDSVQEKTKQIYLEGVPYRSSKSGRTYTIKIVKDPNSPDIAPKRQAIAQDFRGITVLTGPSSFASSPDVLVEELKFRIENQLP